MARAPSLFRCGHNPQPVAIEPTSSTVQTETTGAMAPVVPLGMVEIRRNRLESGVTLGALDGVRSRRTPSGQGSCHLRDGNFFRAFPSFMPSGSPEDSPSMH